MASCNCKNKKACPRCSGDPVAQLTSKVNALQSALEKVQKNTKFLDCGNPILMIKRDTDIACFDLDTGLGSDCWAGWVVCNGATYTDGNGENVETPEMVNRFPIGAGDQYEVGDTGGEEEVTLEIDHLPAHGHGVTDPGHTHNVTDTGHTHAASAAEHTHTFTGSPHTHSMDSAGHHTHDVQVGNQGSGLRGGGDNTTATAGLATYTTGGGGDHTHTIGQTTAGGTVGNATSAISVSSAFTGVSIVEGFTSVTVDEVGEDEPHNNMPPYYAVLFVMWIG